MQARLAMTAIDAVAAPPMGSKPASGKKAVEGAFAGMLLTSGKLVAHAEHAAVPSDGSPKGSDEEGAFAGMLLTSGKLVAHVEHADVPSEGSPKGSGDGTQTGDSEETAPGTKEAALAIPTGLAPWKALVVNPDAGNSAGPAQTSQEVPAAAGDEAPSQPKTGVPAPQTVGAEEGFAGAGNPTVDVEVAGSAPSIAIEEPLPNPAAEEGVEQTMQATVPEAAVPNPAGTIAAGRSEGAGEKAAPVAARPLEVADVLALKARQLRHQKTGGAAAKPTYEDPRLAGDNVRQVAQKPVRPGVADAVKVAPPTVEQAESPRPAREMGNGPRAIADLAPTVKAVEAEAARAQNVPAAPVNKTGAEATEVADSKAAVAAPEETTSAQEPARHPEDSVKTDTSKAKATPAASPQAEDISGQAAARHDEQSATEKQAGDKAGSDTTIGATRSSGVHDRSAARNANPVFRQVVENLDLQHTGSKVRIQLNPEHLGRLEVALTARDTTLEVRIVADNPQAAQALEGNIRDLTDGLKAKAGHFQHLDVHVEARGTVRVKPEDGQPDRRDQQQRGQERQAGDGRQNDSRERGRRQNRPRAGNEHRAWSWTGAEEESP